MRMFDTFFKEFTTQSNTAWKKTKNSIYTMRMFDTFLKKVHYTIKYSLEKNKEQHIYDENIWYIR
jgi:hypothetical protein